MIHYFWHDVCSVRQAEAVSCHPYVETDMRHETASGKLSDRSFRFSQTLVGTIMFEKSLTTEGTSPSSLSKFLKATEKFSGPINGMHKYKQIEVPCCRVL